MLKYTVVIIHSQTPIPVHSLKKKFGSNTHSSHISLQPKTGLPLKLSRVEPGQYLDGRPPGKTRLLLEEVLVRLAGGAHPVVCVGPNTPV